MRRPRRIGNQGRERELVKLGNAAGCVKFPETTDGVRPSPGAAVTDVLRPPSWRKSAAAGVHAAAPEDGRTPSSFALASHQTQRLLRVFVGIDDAVQQPC